MKKKHIIWLMPLALCMNVANLQAAPTQAQQNAIRSSCQSDYRAHCASVPTGGSAALQCLEKNIASLSSPCQQAVQAATGTAPAPGAGGTTETAPAPPAAAGSAGKPNNPKVVVIQPRQEMRLMRQACGADYKVHCAGVRIGGGGAVSCLVSHAASLSAACKGALNRLGQKF